MRSVLLAMAFCASAAFSGCASIDQSLFGTGPNIATNEPSTTPAPEAPENGDESATAPAVASSVSAATSDTGAPSPEQGVTMPGTLPTTDAGASMSASTAVAPVSAPAAPVAIPTSPPAASVVTVAPGQDTGTPVGHTITSIRASVQDVASRAAGAAQQLNTLRQSNAQQLMTYYQAQAQISARLQIGTTRGNPQLVAQWNAAQGALDQLTANMNALSTLNAQVGGEVTRARESLTQIGSAREAPGAVDEDHRQLAVLEDETNQAILILDRVARDGSADLRRQTAALGSERTKLDQLASAIKAGDLYGADASAQALVSASAAPSPVSSSAAVAGAPIVTIRFARGNTNYQKTLYNALSQALQGQPNISFSVVGVSPPRGSVAAMQAAQNEARRHAQDVMHTMTEMGVPVTRMALSSATDPAAKSSEVRVFIR